MSFLNLPFFFIDKFVKPLKQKKWKGWKKITDGFKDDKKWQESYFTDGEWKCSSPGWYIGKWGPAPWLVKYSCSNPMCLGLEYRSCRVEFNSLIGNTFIKKTWMTDYLLLYDCTMRKKKQSDRTDSLARQTDGQVDRTGGRKGGRQTDRQTF